MAPPEVSHPTSRFGVAYLLRTVAIGVVAVALVAFGTGLGGATAAAQSGSGLVSIGAGVKGPSGLRATTSATGLAHVASLALDPQNRLWVGTAATDDTGDDVVAFVSAAGATPTRVLTGQHRVMGLLWYDGSLYVASGTGVDAYSGFDGTTFATHRTVVALPAKVGLVGGIAIGPSGRMVLGISAPCNACRPTSKYSAAVVSFLPDGSDLRVDVSGVRAPVGLAYYPGTDRLFVTMNQRDDLGRKTPGDWLAVVRSGQNWGFPSCSGPGGSACAEVPGPVAVLDKHAAASGVAIVTGQLGSGVGNAAVVAEWAAGKVLRVGLERSGARAAGKAEPVLTGFENPVPVLVGADGALYVGDWTAGTVTRISARP